MNLDSFAAALNAVTAEATQAATTTVQTNAVISAAASGGTAAVEDLAATMSTEDLLRVRARLQG